MGPRFEVISQKEGIWCLISTFCWNWLSYLFVKYDSSDKPIVAKWTAWPWPQLATDSGGNWAAVSGHWRGVIRSMSFQEPFVWEYDTNLKEHISEENFKEGFVLLNAYLTTYQSKILSDTFAEYNGKIEYNEHDRWQIHRWEDAPSVTSSLLSVYSECQLPLGPVIWDLCIMTLYSMPPDCYFVQIGIFWLKIRPINCVYVRRFLNYCS